MRAACAVLRNGLLKWFWLSLSCAANTVCELSDVEGGRLDICRAVLTTRKVLQLVFEGMMLRLRDKGGML